MLIKKQYIENILLTASKENLTIDKIIKAIPFEVNIEYKMKWNKHEVLEVKIIINPK